MLTRTSREGPPYLPALLRLVFSGLDTFYLNQRWELRIAIDHGGRKRP